MKISDIISLGEHIRIPDQSFGAPILQLGADKGQISLKTRPASVYLKTHLSVIQLIAHKGQEILGFVSLLLIPDREQLAMAKNAQSYVKGENVALNLLIWARRHLDLRIISDYEMTEAGERAWQAMCGSPQLSVKIYNFDEDKIYPLDDPEAARPEADTPASWEDTKWFYIIESQQPNKWGLNEHTYGPGSLLVPYHYADTQMPESW